MTELTAHFFYAYSKCIRLFLRFDNTGILTTAKVLEQPISTIVYKAANRLCRATIFSLILHIEIRDSI